MLHYPEKFGPENNIKNTDTLLCKEAFLTLYNTIIIKMTHETYNM